MSDSIRPEMTGLVCSAHGNVGHERCRYCDEVEVDYLRAQLAQYEKAGPGDERVKSFIDRADRLEPHLAGMEDYANGSESCLIVWGSRALRSAWKQLAEVTRERDGRSRQALHLMSMLLRIGLVGEVWLETWHPELNELRERLGDKK